MWLIDATIKRIIGSPTKFPPDSCLIYQSLSRRLWSDVYNLFAIVSLIKQEQWLHSSPQTKDHSWKCWNTPISWTLSHRPPIKPPNLSLVFFGRSSSRVCSSCVLDALCLENACNCFIDMATGPEPILTAVFQRRCQKRQSCVKKHFLDGHGQRARMFCQVKLNYLASVTDERFDAETPVPQKTDIKVIRRCWSSDTITIFTQSSPKLKKEKFNLFFC